MNTAIGASQVVDLPADAVDTIGAVADDLIQDNAGHVLHTVDLSEHEAFLPGPRHAAVATMAKAMPAVTKTRRRVRMRVSVRFFLAR